jgi:hypothetical protein
MQTITLNAEILRRVAETASGYRYRPTWIKLYRNPGAQGGYRICADENPLAATDTADLAILVQPVDYQEPPQVDTAIIRCGTREIDLLDVNADRTLGFADDGPQRADAVFLSLSAVEKFMTPYYASTYGDDGGRMVTAIIEKMKSARPATDDPGSASDQDPDLAFAIVHLPSSEYVIEAGGEVPVPGAVSIHRGAGPMSIATVPPMPRTNGSRER